MLFFQQKMSPLFFSLALDLSRPFSLWASLAHRLLSLFLGLSFALYSKFVDMTSNTLENTDTETISAFRFRLHWLFGYLCFTRREYLCDSRQNNLELHLCCHTWWLSFFTSVCLWCGWAVGRAVGRWTVTWLLNFLGWVVYHIFLPMVLRFARFAREISGIKSQFL